MINTVGINANISAIGAAQKIPVTPNFKEAISEAIIRKTSRSIDSGAARCALPIDCKSIAQTFCRQVNSISDK